MLKAILLDLDGTLLANAMETFVPAYFRALTRYLSHLIPPDHLVSALMSGMHAMEANDGTGPTNEEAFASVFYPALKHSQDQLIPIFFEFYKTEFTKLESLTQAVPEARPLVQWAFDNDMQVVIATNPIFPSVAIEQRLVWAGIPASDIDYSLVTTYENMHSIKPHPAYYREILSGLDRQPSECLMVGDDWRNDIAPAVSLGISSFWIARPEEPIPSGDVPLLGRGTLEDLWTLVRKGGRIK